MNFYDTTFICTYKQADDDITDDLYRSQFLQSFKMEIFRSCCLEVNITSCHQMIPWLLYVCASS